MRYCSNCTILNNTITPFIEPYPGTGIAVWGGASTVIAGNRIMNNLCGIFLGEGTHNNSIFGNTITNNTRGVQIHRSQNNSLYNNNFNKKFNIFILAGPPGTTLVNHFDNNPIGHWNNNRIGSNEVIPEFPSWTPLLVMLLAVTIMGIVYKRKLHFPNH